MKTILLAAGLGTRLRDVAGDVPKPLFEINGKSLIEYSLDSLSKAGIKEVDIVTGFKGKMIQNTLGQKYGDINITYSKNLCYATTGTMHGVYSAMNNPQDSLLLDADLVFEPGVISSLLDYKNKDALFLTPCCGSGDETYVVLDNQERVIYLSLINNINKSLIEGKESHEFNGIAKFSKNFMQALINRYKVCLDQEETKRYYEELAFELGKEIPLYGCLNQGFALAEVDRKEDIPRAKQVIQKLEKLI